MELGLEGRACLVGGGIGGIGGEVARRLEAAGAEVLLLDDPGDATAERLGSVDVLVNCAGAECPDGGEELTEAELRAQHELRVIGPLRAMRTAAPAMAARGWGRIVNVCSSLGQHPAAAAPAGSVTSAAELSLSRLFADRYARGGVLVNSVCPDSTESETAIAELATTIVFLCSEPASYVNGAAWPLPGAPARR